MIYLKKENLCNHFRGQKGAMNTEKTYYFLIIKFTKPYFKSDI